jgi:hypothetical protein
MFLLYIPFSVLVRLVDNYICSVNYFSCGLLDIVYDYDVRGCYGFI